MNVLFAALIGGFALGQAAPNLQYFQKGKASGASVFAIIARRPVIADTASAAAPAGCEGHLELRNVGFAYPARPENPVFKDFSLRVAAGKTIALVGESGSGKSTVVGLIERFYDPQQGQVSCQPLYFLRTAACQWQCVKSHCTCVDGMYLHNSCAMLESKLGRLGRKSSAMLTAASICKSWRAIPPCCT